jgi:hypothetical protein
MRVAPGTPPLSARVRAAAAVAALAAGLVACEAPETTWRQRTADDWAGRLWSRDPKEATKAGEELVAFAKKAPALVVDALARQLSKAPPDPVATPLSFAIDRDAARRLGMPDVGAGEVTRLDLPVLRARAEAVGLPVTRWRTTSDGQVHLEFTGSRPRAELERLLTLLATRGALEVRTEGGDVLLDDRAVAAATLDRALDGRPFVVAHVKNEPAAEVRKALAAVGGAKVSVVVDGTVRATIPAPVLSGGRVALPLWRDAAAAADREAADLALALGTGRLEVPLVPMPLGVDVGVGPPAENPFSTTLAAIGEPAAATLDRLAADAPHEWTRRSAAWAKARLRR